MTRIDACFKRLRRQGKKAFIAFITAGYPDLKATVRLIFELQDAGADIIELGVPFSDPIADGPVIQESSQAALKRGVSLRKILALVARHRKVIRVPLCLMTYYNPVFCFGKGKFIAAAVKAGIDGLIIPDLPPEEDKEFLAAAVSAGIDTVCFLSPTTTDERARFICARSRGFIYYVSLTGVTGPRRKLPADLRARLGFIKSVTGKPLCVGFGISRPSQVEEISRLADGVIVGSALIRKIKEYRGRSDMPRRVGRYAAYLKGRI